MRPSTMFFLVGVVVAILATVAAWLHSVAGIIVGLVGLIGCFLFSATEASYDGYNDGYNDGLNRAREVE